LNADTHKNGKRVAHQLAKLSISSSGMGKIWLVIGDSGIEFL